jgi:hypothetical protein
VAAKNAEVQVESNPTGGLSSLPNVGALAGQKVGQMNKTSNQTGVNSQTYLH